MRLTGRTWLVGLMALLVAGRAFSEDASYIDGNVAAEKATPDGKRDFSANSVRIGEFRFHFNGPIDDVRIDWCIPPSDASVTPEGVPMTMNFAPE